MSDDTTSEGPWIPEEGTKWRDGIDGGFVWEIKQIEHGTVYMDFGLVSDDKRVTREWPANRWNALVDRQRLILMRRA